MIKDFIFNSEFKIILKTNMGNDFFLLVRFNLQETTEWVGKSLQTLPTRTVTGTVIATPHQLQEFQQLLAV